MKLTLTSWNKIRVLPTAGELFDIGHAVDIAIGRGQIVVRIIVECAAQATNQILPLGINVYGDRLLPGRQDGRKT